MSDPTSRLWDVVETYVSAEGIELDDVEIRGVGPGTVVRVVVDADTGVGVDHIARLSRGLSRALDADDPMAGAYTLEVTSPGLERSLRRPRHFEKSIGREAKVKTRVPVCDAKNHRGKIRASDERGFVLEVDGAERRIGYDDVAAARTVFVWEKKAKPGKRH
ncbi:MAG: ribosome maturation factor RimP [Acidimicrobiia bacterium]